MNVIIYARVSSDEQAEGTSLDYQEITLREYCRKHKYNIIDSYREDYSAKDFEHRPEIQKIMKYCRSHKKGIELILFLRWDRYSRNLEYALTNIRELQCMGISVNSIENPLDFDSPDCALMLGVYVGGAQSDNIKRGKATRDGIHQSLEKGKCTNKAPRGYKNVKVDDYNKYVAIEPDKAKMIQEIFEKVSLGVESPNYIRRQYERKGFKINKNSFMDMLRNHFYIGEIFVPEYKDIPAHYVRGLHQAIIETEIFYKVQEAIDGKKKNAPKLSKKINPDLFLRKYIVCPICGHAITGATSSGDGGKYTYYNCAYDAKHIRYRAEDANKMFTQYIAGLKPNETVLNLYKAILMDLKTEEDGSTKQEAGALKMELKKIDERIANVDDKFVDGDVDKNTHSRLIDKYQKEKDGLQQRIEIMLNPKRANIEPKLDYSINLIKGQPIFPVDGRRSLTL